MNARPVVVRSTTCPVTRGLDALLSRDKGVMSRLDATTKPARVKGGTPSVLRTTNPFKTPFFTLFFLLLVPHLEKIGKLALKGLVVRRRLILVPRIMLLASTVCGASPPNKPTRGRVFLLAGAAKFIRLPPAISGSLWVNARWWVRRRKLTISSKSNLLASHPFPFSGKPSTESLKVKINLHDTICKRTHVECRNAGCKDLKRQ